MYTRCLNCESTSIIPDLRLEDAGPYPSAEHQVRVNRAPGALIFRNPLQVHLRAFVCGDCGYTALFVENPADLYAAYLDASGRAAQNSAGIETTRLSDSE